MEVLRHCDVCQKARSHDPLTQFISESGFVAIQTAHAWNIEYECAWVIVDGFNSRREETGCHVKDRKSLVFAVSNTTDDRNACERFSLKTAHSPLNAYRTGLPVCGEDSLQRRLTIEQSYGQFVQFRPPVHHSLDREIRRMQSGIHQR